MPTNPWPNRWHKQAFISTGAMGVGWGVWRSLRLRLNSAEAEALLDLAIMVGINCKMKLNHAIIPKVLKIHNKLDKLDRKNYCSAPIYKVLEKIVYEQIYNYFTKNHLFHPNLHSYQRNRSTQTALPQMYDRWVRSAHTGQLSGVVLLDLSAAFDLLLQKLKVYGFDDNVRAWVESYLTERFQSVCIDHALSNFLSCKVGVLQGLLFFLIYFNDLPHPLNCPADAYADDNKG